MKQSAGVLDNNSLGNVVVELKGNILAGCTLSVVSSLFSLYAYEKLKKELLKVSQFRLLVPYYGAGEGFLKDLHGNHIDRHLRNRLAVTWVALECVEQVQETASFYESRSFEIPDLITYFRNETNLTRWTIVKIVNDSGRPESFKNNSQKFIEHTSIIIQHQMRLFVVEGSRYHKIGDDHFYAQELFRDNELFGYLQKNMADFTMEIRQIINRRVMDRVISTVAELLSAA